MEDEVVQAPPIMFRSWQCTGTGFTAFGHHRESRSTIGRELRTRQTRIDPSSRFSRRGPPPEKPLTWWQAQVSLYCLECPLADRHSKVGLKRVLFTAMQSDSLRVPDEIADAEEICNEAYRCINAPYVRRAEETRIARYNELPSDEEKVRADIDRFMGEVAAEGRVRRLVGLDVHERFNVHQAAEEFGIKTQSTGHDRCRILILGRTHDEVSQEIRRLTLAESEISESDEEEREGEASESEHSVESEESVKSEESEDDDNVISDSIGGRWSLEMPALVRTFGEEDGSLWWDINRPTSGSVWASFDIGILEGITKIEGRGPLIGRQRSFTWKGAETGEGVIQWMRYEGSVTFTSPNECHGH
jgi:hypothetical protein